MLIFIYIIKGIWLISMFLSSPSNTISVSSLEASNKVSGFLHPLLWIPLFPPLFSCCTCQFLSLSSLYFNPSWSNVPVVPHSIHLLHWNCCCLGIHWVHCWIKIICLLIPLDKSVQQGGSMHVGTAKMMHRFGFPSCSFKLQKPRLFKFHIPFSVCLTWSN